VSRLSNLQRVALEDIAASEDSAVNGVSIPLYSEHLSREIRLGFNTVSEERRWLANLEARGFIKIHNNCFLRLTEAGRLALAGYPPAVRRDFHAEATADRRKGEA
jgi:hypothetical protein